MCAHRLPRTAGSRTCTRREGEHHPRRRARVWSEFQQRRAERQCAIVPAHCALLVSGWLGAGGVAVLALSPPVVLLAEMSSMLPSRSLCAHVVAVSRCRPKDEAKVSLLWRCCGGCGAMSIYRSARRGAGHERLAVHQQHGGVDADTPAQRLDRTRQNRL